MKNKRIIDLRVLPGQPTDGNGRMCIHLFLKDEVGPFVEPCVWHPADNDNSQPVEGNRIIAKPTRGRLACDPKRTVAPVKRGNVTTITMRTDDPHAVTCPKCMASKEYKSATNTEE